jgi:uncharacterized protein (TIGR02678 family)
VEEKDQIRLGVATLLDNYWITRKEYPEEYLIIRKHKKTIQKYFVDYFGYQLFMTTNLIKLEKVPHTPEQWMGVQEFHEPLDYSIFVAILAYLEEKAQDDMFLISMLSDFVKNFFTNELELKWEVYKHRLSFVRAMKFVEKMELVDVIQGEIDQYRDDMEREVLYRPTMISKYFMRFFTKPIKEFNAVRDLYQVNHDEVHKPVEKEELNDRLDNLMTEMLINKWKNENESNTPRENLQSLNRRLFFSPIVYRHELTEEEKKYFTLQSFRMVEAIAEYTDLEMEIYRNEMLLISKKRSSRLEQHPAQKAISDIALQFGLFFHAMVKQLEEKPEGEYRLTHHKFEELIEDLHKEFGHGWSKEYRESYPEEVAKKLLEYLTEWKLADYETVTSTITIYPATTRIVGDYPVDYKFQNYFLLKVKQTVENYFTEDQFTISKDEFEQWIAEFKENQKLPTPSKTKDMLDAVSKFSDLDDDNNVLIMVEKVRKKKGD